MFGRPSTLLRASSSDPSSAYSVGTSPGCRYGGPQKDLAFKHLQRSAAIFIPTRKKCLEEIVGDELRPAPGGDAYKNALKRFLHPYDETRILVSSRDQLLTLYDGRTVTPFVTQADEYLKKNKIYTTTPIKNGGFCITPLSGVTTLSGGAIVIEHDGKLRQNIDVAAGLPSSDILTAFVDREGSLWLGHDEGVARVALDSPISILSRAAYLDVIEFQGSIYASTGGEAAPTPGSSSTQIRVIRA